MFSLNLIQLNSYRIIRFLKCFDNDVFQNSPKRLLEFGECTNLNYGLENLLRALPLETIFRLKTERVEKLKFFSGQRGWKAPYLVKATYKC